MAEVTKLTLAVDSTQVRQASGDLDRFSKAGTNTQKTAQGLVGTFRGLSAAAGAVAGSLVAREVIQAADAYKNLNARLQLATKNAQEFAKAQTEILNISNRTRVGLEQTSDLYASLARSTESLGVSQDDLLGVTESINQALIISGGSAQSAQAALVQLGQGFASGALRGEELNSVLEQAPRLARAIADGLGVPIGQLRELGKEGELTAEKVFTALQKSGARLKAEFDQIPLTVDQATTVAGNALSVLIGSIDDATGATSSLSQGIVFVADAVRVLADEIQRASKGAEDVGFLARAFTIVSQTVRILLSDVVFVFKGIVREIGAVAAQLAALGRLDFKSFTAISDAVKADARRAREELDRYQQQVLNPFLNSRGRGTSQGFTDPRLIGATPAEETVGFRPRGTVTSSGGKKKTGGTAREKISEAERYLQNLQRQLEATQDLSVTEQLLRDIQLGRLGSVSEAQKAQLLEIAGQIDAYNQLQEQERLRAEESRKALAERNRILAEGQRIYEETRTPAEQLNIEIDRLNKLLNEGAINWDTYSRAVLNAQERFDESQKALDKTKDGIDDFAKKANESIQQAFGQELTNILEGNFKNIGDSFTKLINRMVAEALAADLARALGLGGSSGATSGGGFGSIFSAITGLFGARAIGGPVSSNGMYRVNERGPELLSVAGKEYLMMGGQMGKVTPTQAQSSNITNINVSVPVPNQNQRATALQFARDVAKQLQVATLRNG